MATKDEDKKTEPTTAVCVVCKKEFKKAEMELVKNQFTCKDCLPEGVEPTEKEETKSNLEIKDAEDRLDGMAKICKHASRCETTILDWIRTRNFPAGKFSGGHQWYSSKSSIDAWWNTEVGKISR